LQEVWQPEHVNMLVSTVKADFPYAHWSVTAGDGSYGCSQTETDLLVGCINEKCAEVELTAMAGCAVKNCANEYAAVSKGCQRCVLANQTQPPTAIAANCQSSDPNAVAYENQNGLLLLSKHPLKFAEYLGMESSLGDRGVLLARVETGLLPAVDLFCTHLAATLTEVSYTGPYGTWEGERAVQIAALGESLRDKVQNAHTAVVMGDMNCGPGSDDLIAEDSAGFGQLLAVGLQAPYLDSGDAQCTYCSDNTAMSNSGTLGVMIDHVLFSNLPDTTANATRRFFDDPVTLDIGGEAVEAFRSDHYGLMVTVSPARSD
jgi:endonuclease/exonuclease/phosphatase family metal-dependent hydrolase